MDSVYLCLFFPANSFRGKTAQCLSVSCFAFLLLRALAIPFVCPCTIQAMMDELFERDGGVEKNQDSDQSPGEFLSANLLGVFLVIENGLPIIQITLGNMKKRKK